MSKLTKDLNTVAGIVGSLGLSIAEAQREMNRDYLEALERLVAIAISLQHGKKLKADGTAGTVDAVLENTDKEFVQDFIAKFAPTRYQYTKTSLTVRLDLAQSLSASGSAGVGGSIGAVAVNASLAIAYGSQYQAAAECKTTIDAVPADADLKLIKDLGQRAADASATSLALPARAPVDQATIDSSNAIIRKLLGIEPAPIAETPAPTT